MTWLLRSWKEFSFLFQFKFEDGCFEGLFLQFFKRNAPFVKVVNCFQIYEKMINGVKITNWLCWKAAGMESSRIEEKFSRVPASGLNCQISLRFQFFSRCWAKIWGRNISVRWFWKTYAKQPAIWYLSKKAGYHRQFFRLSIWYWRYFRWRMRFFKKTMFLHLNLYFFQLWTSYDFWL